jgi:hypothetical protein
MVGKGRSIVHGVPFAQVGLLGLLLGAAACGDATSGPELEAPPAPSALTASAPIAGAHAGVRVDLAHEVHHLRGLVRQTDGSYHSVCVDAPDGLKPAAALTSGPAAAASPVRPPVRPDVRPPVRQDVRPPVRPDVRR